nr:unnamed protein product [Callosobruchus analis]
MAVKRLYTVERKFKKDPLFKQAYIEFMKEYEALNHICITICTRCLRVREVNEQCRAISCEPHMFKISCSPVKGALNPTLGTLWSSSPNKAMRKDSTIVLSWVVTCPSKLKVITANRVAEIQRMTEFHQWRYVPTHLNPADLVSRGVTPHELINGSNLWWNGPTFLTENSCNWPTLPTLNQLVAELK